MNRLLLICFVILIASNDAFASDQAFYYLEGDSVYLYPSDNKVVIGFEEDNIGNLSGVFMDYPSLNDTIQPSQFNPNFFVFGLNPGTNISDLLDTLNHDARILLAQYVYQNAQGGEVVFGNKITIHVSNSMTSDYYDSLLNYYGVNQYGFDDTKPAIRYLKIDSIEDLSVLNIANRLY